MRREKQVTMKKDGSRNCLSEKRYMNVMSIKVLFSAPVAKRGGTKIVSTMKAGTYLFQYD